MDDLVKQAMAKWPNVPACYGWLGLDARGDWYMRDDQAQTAGPFSGDGATLQSKGSRLQHTALIAFIGRNYGVDAQGNWYFQNGPQRVYVSLACTPWIARISGDGSVKTHTGDNVKPTAAWVDEQGRCYFSLERGLALIHTQDVELFSRLLESGVWTVQAIQSGELSARFGFNPNPQAD